MSCRAKPLIETPAVTLREAQTKTLCHALRNVKVEVISDTLVEEEANKVVDTWPDRVWMTYLEAEALINTLSDALA